MDSLLFLLLRGGGGGGELGDFIKKNSSPLSKQTIMHIQVYSGQARETVNFIFLLFS